MKSVNHSKAFLVKCLRCKWTTGYETNHIKIIAGEKKRHSLYNDLKCDSKKSSLSEVLSLLVKTFLKAY